VLYLVHQEYGVCAYHVLLHNMSSCSIKLLRMLVPRRKWRRTSTTATTRQGPSFLAPLRSLSSSSSTSEDEKSETPSLPKSDQQTTDVTTTSSSPDYSRNDGIIEGVWIFSRHGDRTPSRPLTPDHRRAEEAAYWMTKLPTPDSYAVFTSFSKHFPVSVHDPNHHEPHAFIDVVRNPFGFLTSKGLHQLADNGQRFYNRYNIHGHHIPQHTLFRSPKDFLTIWDVKVYSTNYLRTIMSIQSFLDGLFQTQCYSRSKSTSSNNSQDRTYDPNIIKEERIPSLSLNHSHDTDKTTNPLVTVNVRNARCDPLNAFDRNPTLISHLVSEVMSTDDFMLRDSKAACFAARLSNILPGMSTPICSHFATTYVRV
jgi:Histidine phosphatase superfamily (branch 2)